MPLPQSVETADRFEVASSLRAGVRIAFAALVSAGAVLVSGLLVGAAVAGTSSRIVLDRRAGTVARTTWAPAGPRTTRAFPLRDVVAVELGEHDWSDGEPTFHVRFVLVDGTVLETGPSRSRERTDALRTRLVRFLAQGAGPVLGGSHA